MNTASWIAYNQLLGKCSPEKKAALKNYLSKEEQEKLQDLTPLDHDPFAIHRSMQDCLQGIHYSWMIPHIEPFSTEDKVALLSSLGKEQADKLKAHFKIKKSLIPLTEQTKAFLQSTLYESLISGQKEFVPLEYLPPYPLNALLKLSKKQLQRLVDYLGLHDLAVEMKKIVKSEQIKKIQKTLSKAESVQLKLLLKSKEPVSFARLNLDGWDGNEESLKTILHHRGFNRLAKALFGCHPSLTWHLSHRLDTGRTKILRKFFTDINNDAAKEALITQINQLIPTIKQNYA